MGAIAFDPNRTAEFTFTDDRDSPESEQRRFVSRFVTVRQTVRLRELEEASREKGTSDTDSNDRLNEALGVAIVGWRGVVDEDGQPIPFAAEAATDERPRRITALDACMTLTEKWRLVLQIPDAVAVIELQTKKASASPPASEAVKSAGAAVAENA